ncbi:MAG: hypothetical protein EXR98_03090 [Gemmataceae bacterium]|nr:hypothetical protein [Gemmataceae bacterium]
MAANKFTFTRSSIVRHGAWLTGVLGIVILSVLGAHAQTEPISPARARQALRSAIDNYKKQDYERAADYLADAQAGQQALSATELEDLAKFSAQNSIALRNRQDGGAQLKLAEDALKESRTNDLGNLLKSLGANQYLDAAERQQLADLSRRAQAQPKGASQIQPAKGDAKSLLASGRVALQAGDFVTAKAMAAQADKASSMLPNWLQPWSDTPAKLSRDIQTAEAKQAPLALPKPIEGANSEPAPKSTTSKLLPFWPFGGGSSEAAKKEESIERKIDEKIGRQALKDGFIFLEANDLDKARFVAKKVKEMNINFAPGESTPDMLLAEIARRSGGPAVVLPDPKTAQVKKPTEIKPPPPSNNDPRALLKHGRLMLEKKQYDAADKACAQSSAANGKWGLFEDNPDKLRKDLQRARASSDRDESVKLMVDARKLAVAGSLDEAEKNAFRAKTLHGPYGVFDFGDRPDKLLEEIHRTRQAKGLPNQNDKSNLAKDGGLKDPPFIPAGIQNANKNRAIVMLREASELERQGMLVEARLKAIEARGFKASFTPDEESPDAFLSRLYATCDRHIHTHLQKASAAANQAADAQRFEKANAEIALARKLALTFELDGGRIDQAARYLQQVAAGSAPLTPNPIDVATANDDRPTGDPKKDAARKLAREKLAQAQLELSHGKTASARAMAMHLFNPEFGIQKEVLALIRSISAEEYNQQVLEAKRTFDAGLDAFLQNDYRKAMFVFQSIDTQMLPDQYQVRLRDIMSTREMHSGNLAQAHYEKLPGTKIETKGGLETAIGAEKDSLMDTVKAREQIQYQALRQRGQEALRLSADLFKAKDRDQKEQGIQTLKDYIAQVNLAQLDPQKTNELRRMPEGRIQQYKTFLADETLADLGKKERFTSFYDEGKRQRDIQAYQGMIVDKMKLVAELMKQNKLKEADAEVTKVLEIDRENVAAVAAKSIITVRRNQEEYNRQVKANERDFLVQGSVELKAGLTMDDPISFKKGHQRPVSSGEISHPLRDPKERAIEYRLRQPISLHFKDVPLEQAIKDLTVTSGIQVVPDYAALDLEKINLQSPLTISVDNIDMKSALKLMLNRLKLTYTIENQVLMITTESNTSGRLVRVTYPIADLIVAVEDHPLPDVFKMEEAIKRSMMGQGGMNNFLTPSPYQNSMGTPVSSHGEGGLGSAFGGNGARGPGGMQAPPTKDRSKDGMAEVLKDLIVKTIKRTSWEDMGGTGSIQYFPMGMALVISQPQEVQEEVQLLLSTLRRLQDLQVSVELRAVLVSETFFERIGVDFNMNITTPTNRNEPNLAAGTFVPAPFVNRTGAGLNGLISGLTAAGTLTPDLNIPIRNRTFNFTTPQFGGYQPEAGLSLGLAFLSDIQVFMFLEAVQGDRRAHIMQAPKITVFNGQVATIGGLMVRPTVSGIFPAALANGSMIMIPQINAMPFGLTMTVQPVVSPDRRFIRLNVTPQMSSGVQDPAGAIVMAVPGFAQAQFDGGAQQPSFANAPLNVTVNPLITNLLIANTTVNVPDGGTVLLGGFKFLAEERTEYGPPILSKIPYLSRLFRNVGWSRDGSTLIYLVTARVIMVEEEERLFLGEIPPIPGR